MVRDSDAAWEHLCPKGDPRDSKYDPVCKQAAPGVPFLKPLELDTKQDFSGNLVTRTPCSSPGFSNLSAKDKKYFHSSRFGTSLYVGFYSAGTLKDVTARDEYLDFVKKWQKLGGRGLTKDCTRLEEQSRVKWRNDYRRLHPGKPIPAKYRELTGPTPAYGKCENAPFGGDLWYPD